MRPKIPPNRTHCKVMFNDIRSMSISVRLGIIVCTILFFQGALFGQYKSGPDQDSMLFRKFSFLILFDTDRDIAQKFPEGKFQELIKIMKTDGRLKIRLEARTDSVGDYDYNIGLAQRRLNFAHREMISRGVNPDLFLDNVYGEDFPLMPNESPEGRQTNRSVKVSAGYFEAKEYVSGRIISTSDSLGIPGYLIMNSLYYRDTIPIDSSGNFQFPMAQNAAFSIEFYSPDHILPRRFINLARENSNLGLLPIDKLEVGTVFNFEDILFVTNKPILMPDYQDALPRLLRMVEVAEKYKLEIQGHVNYPNRPPQQKGTFFYDLSEQRARKVYNYLIAHGVDSSRLEWNAYSNWNMMYPTARHENQMRFNRRVAVRVIGRIE
ncbi:MAG: hypothetical protein EA409_10610 [Saprospirales bacterium]|nr:MAG: hypothetical protein EA409_10610 [Saprospirales bacterium]